MSLVDVADKTIGPFKAHLHYRKILAPARIQMVRVPKNAKSCIISFYRANHSENHVLVGCWA